LFAKFITHSTTFCGGGGDFFVKKIKKKIFLMVILKIYAIMMEKISPSPSAGSIGSVNDGASLIPVFSKGRSLGKGWGNGKNCINEISRSTKTLPASAPEPSSLCPPLG